MLGVKTTQSTFVGDPKPIHHSSFSRTISKSHLKEYENLMEFETKPPEDPSPPDIIGRMDLMTTRLQKLDQGAADVWRTASQIRRLDLLQKLADSSRQITKPTTNAALPPYVRPLVIPVCPRSTEDFKGKCSPLLVSDAMSDEEDFEMSDDSDEDWEDEYLFSDEEFDVAVACDSISKEEFAIADEQEFDIAKADFIELDVESSCVPTSSTRGLSTRSELNSISQSAETYMKKPILPIVTLGTRRLLACNQCKTEEVSKRFELSR
eukprot:gb/GEZN01009450.1/.p1 GENE.gb/GEZN01009450.1/~~gb/GEZN01009450.1/.p1  ORF type:complete len:265 (-),score=28.76 gb/GEZN01009450.1/:455-1249(-)